MSPQPKRKAPSVRNPLVTEHLRLLDRVREFLKAKDQIREVVRIKDQLPEILNAEGVLELRKRETKDGNPLAPLDAYLFCRRLHLPVPDWVHAFLSARIGRYFRTRGRDTMDQAFGLGRRVWKSYEVQGFWQYLAKGVFHLTLVGIPLPDACKRVAAKWFPFARRDNSSKVNSTFPVTARKTFAEFEGTLTQHYYRRWHQYWEKRVKDRPHIKAKMLADREKILKEYPQPRPQ